MKKQAEDWERRAMLAVQEGRDDLAKQALVRYNEQLQGAQQLHETWLKHKAETEKLKLSLRQLNDKIEEAKRKKNILVARAKRAEAQQRIQETMSGHVRQERVRVVRAHGGEDRGHRAQGARGGRAATRSSRATGSPSSSRRSSTRAAPTSSSSSSSRGWGCCPAPGQPTRQLNKGAGDVHDAELVEEGDEGSTR